MKNWIQSAVTGLLLERPGQKRSIAEHAAELSDLGASLLAHCAECAGSPGNCAQLRHIIAIERWGQRRLRVFLGDPSTADESDAHYPPDDLGWEDLQALFEQARADTVHLAVALAHAELDPVLTVPHNQYGKLTVFGWLHYLAAHANLESKRIR